MHIPGDILALLGNKMLREGEGKITAALLFSINVTFTLALQLQSSSGSVGLLKCSVLLATGWELEHWVAVGLAAVGPSHGPRSSRTQSRTGSLLLPVIAKGSRGGDGVLAIALARLHVVTLVILYLLVGDRNNHNKSW